MSGGISRLPEFKPCTDEFYFEGPKKLKLFGRQWKLSGVASKGTILGVHGYSEHSDRYAHFAHFLNENKYDVIWLDLPGHGLSEGRRSDIENFDDYVKSLELLVSEAEAKKCPKPFHLFAHSLGGLVAIRFAESSVYVQRISTLTLSSPLLGLPRFKNWQLPWLSFLLGLVPNLTLKNDTELAGNVLARDAEIMAARVADPLIKSQITIRWVREFLRARLFAFREVNNIRVPVGLFLAGVEKVVSRSESERFYSLVQSAKKLKIYEESLHEILNDTRRKEVMQDILKWIEENR
jgi:alpha-beta hydrolase superfamily lysophospholipase